MTLIILTMFCISFITFAVLIFKRQSSGSSKYTVTEQFNVNSEYLWQIITDYETQPLWRNGLVKVEKIVNSKGRDIWKETDVNGQQIEWESFAHLRNRKLVRNTVSEDMSVISTHTYELKPFGEICVLTLTEVTQANNLILKWIKYNFSGATSELGQLIRDLREKVNNDIADRTNS